MTNSLKCLVAVLVLAAIFAATVRAEAPAADNITIEGNVVKAQSWTAQRINAELVKDIGTINYQVRDVTRTSQAARLLALIKASGLTFDPAIKHQEMRCVVLVEGRDGYVAAFALAELLPEVGNRDVWVALDREGKPLEGRDLPASLITPSDEKPSRAVYGVKTVRVFDPTK